MALVKCPECNKEVSDEAKTCPFCGYFLKKVEKEKQKKKTMGTIALILGIVSVILSFYYEPFGKASTALHGLPGYQPYSVLSLIQPVLVIVGIITIKTIPVLGSIIFFISACLLVIALPYGFFHAVILIIAGVLGIKSRKKINK